MCIYKCISDSINSHKTTQPQSFVKLKAIQLYGCMWIYLGNTKCQWGAEPCQKVLPRWTHKIITNHILLELVIIHIWYKIHISWEELSCIWQYRQCKLALADIRFSIPMLRMYVHTAQGNTHPQYKKGTDKNINVDTNTKDLLQYYCSYVHTGAICVHTYVRRFLYSTTYIIVCIHFIQHTLKPGC